MARVERVERVKAYLKSVSKRGDSCRAKVGYGMRYGIYVHEAVPGAPNPPKTDAQRAAMMIAIREREARGHVPWSTGQPKFLEQPAREYAQEMADVIHKNLRNKESLETAVTRAAYFLLRKSMELVPVDTGALRASGAVEVFKTRRA